MEALTGENAYLFRHAVMREAAYQLHMPTGRARLHGLAFEILESVVPESERARVALELADHARAASTSGDDLFAQKESQYLRVAAAEEQRTWRLASAVQLMLRAARHAATPAEESFRCLRVAAGLMTDMGQPHDADALMDRAEAIVGLQANPEREIRFQIDRGRIAYVSGRHELAVQVLEKARQRAQHLGDQTLIRDALSCESSAYDFLGRLEEALAAAQAALDIAKAQNDIAVINRDTGNIGTLYARLGRLDQAESCMLSAIAGHKAAGQLRFEAIVSGNMSLVQDMLGRPQAALKWQQEALACMRRLGDRPSQGYMLGNLADLLRKQGLLHAALSAQLRGAELLRESGMRNAELVLRRNLGLAWLALGRREQAEALADSIRTDVRHFDPAFRVRALSRLEAALALAEPHRDVDLARSLLDTAKQACKQAGAHENSEAGQEVLRMTRLVEYCQAELARHAGQWPLFRGFSPKSMSPLERFAHWLRLTVQEPQEAARLTRSQPALALAMQEGTDSLSPPDWNSTSYE